MTSHEMEWAIVQGDRVVEVWPAETPPGDGWPEGITIIEVPVTLGVVRGWTYGPTGLVPPPAPTLEEARAAKLAELRATCSATITGGFSSSALGSPHRYPSGQVDQINLMGSVTASLLPGLAPDWTTPFWCADEGGGWSFRDHSAEQIQRVGADGKAHISSCQARMEILGSQISDAASTEAVEDLSWSL